MFSIYYSALVNLKALSSYQAQRHDKNTRSSNDNHAYDLISSLGYQGVIFSVFYVLIFIKNIKFTCIDFCQINLLCILKCS